jgi:hypothetical protein
MQRIASLYVSLRPFNARALGEASINPAYRCAYAGYDATVRHGQSPWGQFMTKFALLIAAMVSVGSVSARARKK